MVTGPTGSGKTTTLYGSMTQINTGDKNILTIEDPVEYSLDGISQVQVNVKKGLTFAVGLRSFLRQDPDVMLVGEMRDAETFETAMHAAETGHLVFGTIHASTAPSCIGRILDLFPQDMHRALRSSMAFNMKGIIAQKLVPTVLEDPKRVPIVEIMKFTPVVRKLILEEEDSKLVDAIRIGREDGMQLFNDSLYKFIEDEFISRATAFEVSGSVEELTMMLKGIDVKASAIL